MDGRFEELSRTFQIRLGAFSRPGCRLRHLFKNSLTSPSSSPSLPSVFPSLSLIPTSIKLVCSLCVVFDLGKGFENCVLVLPTDAYNFGHYITLLYYPDKSLISIFCSYGYSIDVDLKLATYLKNYDYRVRQSLPRLIDNYSGVVQVNNLRFQSKFDEIATCGKHATARIIYRDIIDHKDYYDFLKFKTLTKDQIVSLMFL